MKPKFIHAYMETANIFAKLSTAKKLQVGCIVVKDDRIISIGYNGTPAGWDNECEVTLPCGKLDTKPEVLHAEFNAITKLAKSTESGAGATVFVTHAPCLECAKAIFASGAKEVYYESDYKNFNGINFLLQCNIPVTKTGE